MKQRPLFIAGGAVVALTVVYFGLSAYSSSRAEKVLKDWVFEHQLDQNVSWESVSSSPLGGRITVNGLRVNFGERAPRFEVAALDIADRVMDEDRARIRLRFKGVDIDDKSREGLAGASAFLMGPVGMGAANFGFAAAVSSGLARPEPFDAALHVDIDDKSGTVDAEVSLDMPELYAADTSYRMTGVRGLTRRINALNGITTENEAAQMAVYGVLPEIAQAVEMGELVHAEFSVKDRGMAKRSIALYQRYNTPLDPTKGDPEKQRRDYFVGVMKSVRADCTKRFTKLPKGLVDGCDVVTRVLSGDATGLRVRVEPADRVRISDLARLSDPQRSQLLLERLNPTIERL